MLWGTADGSAVTGPLILTLLFIYILALFVVAWRADREPTPPESPRHRALVYGLSIAVYFTAWTYYGAVGTAARTGWQYLPIYLGPALAITLGFPLWRRIAIAAKHENVGSIADFLAARYGKNQMLGTLVACVTIIGTMPYTALQLKSLSMAWVMASDHQAYSGLAVPVIAAVLAGFAILFGARRPTLTEHSRGLVRAVALESIVKLAALASVAVLGAIFIWTAPNPVSWASNIGGLAALPTIDGRFITATLLSFSAVLCLPRQFYVGFVELENPRDIRTARWLLPTYLMLTSLMVVPILAVGPLVLQGGFNNPDMYVLEIGRRLGGPILTAIVFLGGFSAAAAMVMVETVALSAMVSNDLVLPLLARTRWRVDPALNVSRMIVRLRRGAIVVILFFGWLYFRAMDQSEALGQIGLTSFAAVAQLMPALVGGVLWRRGHSVGAIWGTLAGFGVWLYAVAIPQLLPPSLSSVWIADLFWSSEKANGLFVPAVICSLALNITLYVVMSLRARPHLVDRIQSAAFVAAADPDERPEQDHKLQGTVGNLKSLVSQFVGHDDATRAFSQLGREQGRRLRDSETITPALARAAERMLAGAIGAALARRVIGWQLADTARGTDDVVRVLDEAAQAVQFNRELLHTTLDNLDQGVSVVDADLRLVAWNKRYLELFEFPAGFIYVGKPLDDVLRFGAIKAGYKDGEVDDQVERRIAHIRRRQIHAFERDRSDGLILKILGSPMSGGRYVTSYTDVTELRRAAHALTQANEHLEERVESRTHELTEAVSALAAAKLLAERATNSQTRFLAAASHDVLQPLQAARLFVATAKETSGAEATNDLLARADLAIESADRLLRALLNLSRLEIGGVKLEVQPVEIAALLRDLQREFAMAASEKRLTLRVVATRAWVISDPDLLRSVLQNLIGNAIRYTARGAVLIGCRRDAERIRFEVRDSGHGIPEDALGSIFDEFSRLPQGVRASPGAGLGLSIAQRICRLLDHDLTVRSAVGRGSVFSVTVPRSESQGRNAAALAPGALPRGFRVLHVENDEAVQQSMLALLERWGGEVAAASSMEEALTLEGHWDIVLADYKLEKDGNGLDVIEALQGRAEIFALLTADPDEAVIERAADLGVEVIRKPVSPLFLRTFLARNLLAIVSN